MKITMRRALLALLTMVAANGALAGEEMVQDGVLHILNSDQPRDGVETLSFQEMWRVGGEDGEDFFGLITKVLLDSDGTIYLLDTRLSEVAVYSPEGERLDTLSREGEGPGETRYPTNLVFMPDGFLGLVQRYPGKIVKIDREGSPEGEFQPNIADAGFVLLTDCFPNRQGQLTVVGTNVKQRGQLERDDVTFVSNFQLDGREIVRLVEQHDEMNFQHYHFKEDDQNAVSFRQVAVGADGRVYVTMARNAYEIRVFGADGALDRVIVRDFPHRKRTAEEYQEIHDIAVAQASRLSGATFDISRTHRDIENVRMAGDGNLWVAHSRSGIDQPEGVLSTFDVFDPDGHFLKQVQVRLPGNGEDDAVFFAPNGDAIVVTGFAPALLSLQTNFGGRKEDDDAEPMEVIYFKKVG